MGNFTERLKHWPILGVGAVAISIAVTGARLLSDRTEAQDVSIYTVTATSKPVEVKLSVAGTIQPSNVVVVPSPFDGAIRAKRVGHGDRVERGQVLLILDTSDIDMRLREAEAVLIRAQEAVHDLEHWANGVDVSRARRAVAAAQLAFDELVRKEADGRNLFSRGIIPRSEYDGISEQLNIQRLQLDSAKQDMEVVLERATANNKRLSILELDSARSRLLELQKQKACHVVVAPVSGLILRSATNEGVAQIPIMVGNHVGKGQPLFSIGDDHSLNVTSLVDEIDVNRIVEGQSAEISMDAFGSNPLQGRIARISSQAATEGAVGGQGRAFDIVVQLPELTEAQRKHVRIGMSATLSTVTYRNPSAVVLPMGAVHFGKQGAFVYRRSGAANVFQEVFVTTGQSIPDGIEITAGIRPGDVVAVGRV